jgi:hypothetical protein
VQGIWIRPRRVGRGAWKAVNARAVPTRATFEDPPSG